MAFTEELRFTEARPQLLLINRAPGASWNPNRPNTITEALFRDVIGAIGIGRNVSGSRRLGLSFIISYLNGRPDELARTVERLLDLSQRLDIPLLLVLDGQNWWDYRSDLWNWWDAKRAGFDPDNAANVEWTEPGSQHAVKICWRNWGRQIRVRPPPNLASIRFRDACRIELSRLTRLIKQWADQLPQDKRYLFPGIKIGWEASIGINAFHYPNGNHYLEAHPADPSQDPKHGLDMNKDFAGGLVPLGYAALASSGGRADQRITLADHERIVADYLRFIASVCRAEGIRPDEIFLHAGGQFAPWQLHYSHKVAFNDDGVPGYSFYDVRPKQAGDFDDAMKQTRRQQWCAAEWLIHKKTTDEWIGELEGALGFRFCRNLSIYNWEGIRDKPYAVEAVGRVLANEPRGSSD